MADNDYRKEIDQLKKDIEALREDMSGLVDAVKAEGRQRAGEARDKARDEFERRLRQLNEAYGEIRNEGAHAYDAVHDRLEDRPLTSVAVAFGLGMVLGKLFSSGR